LDHHRFITAIGAPARYAHPMRLLLTYLAGALGGAGSLIGIGQAYARSGST
jgi:hypothetical protein